MLKSLAAHSSVPVWNGLTDEYHPTQVLADLLTIQEHIARPFSEVKLVYAGDARNNTANSLMIASAKMGMQYTALATAGTLSLREPYSRNQGSVRRDGLPY